MGAVAKKCSNSLFLGRRVLGEKRFQTVKIDLAVDAHRPLLAIMAKPTIHPAR